jgi:hypothetical protein
MINRLLRNMVQNEYLLLPKMETMFSQRGGMGNVYGLDINSPRVLSAAKINITTGIRTIAAMITRIRY